MSNVGWMQLFKECTDRFFAAVNEDGGKDYGFHTTRKFPGYINAGLLGKGSVVHFRADYCPGWIFGIWWESVERTEYGADKVSGVVFGQYEQTTEKFKPCRSPFRENIFVIRYKRRDVYDGGYQVCTGNAHLMFNFIHDEPAIAFCRDYRFWNPKYECHTREEAHEIFDEWRNKNG